MRLDRNEVARVSATAADQQATGDVERYGRGFKEDPSATTTTAIGRPAKAINESCRQPIGRDGRVDVNACQAEELDRATAMSG